LENTAVTGADDDMGTSRDSPRGDQSLDNGRQRGAMA